MSGNTDSLGRLLVASVRLPGVCEVRHSWRLEASPRHERALRTYGRQASGAEGSQRVVAKARTNNCLSEIRILPVSRSRASAVTEYQFGGNSRLKMGAAGRAGGRGSGQSASFCELVAEIALIAVDIRVDLGARSAHVPKRTARSRGSSGEV